MAVQKPPEVRQCIDPEHPLFGAVAVRTSRPGPWGVMTVDNGGHHADEHEVEDWEIKK